MCRPPTTDLLRKAWSVVATEDIKVNHVETVQYSESHVVPRCFTQGRKVAPRCFAEVSLPWNRFADLEQEEAQAVVGSLPFEQPDSDEIVDHSIHRCFGHACPSNKRCCAENA